MDKRLGWLAAGLALGAAVQAQDRGFVEARDNGVVFEQHNVPGGPASLSGGSGHTSALALADPAAQTLRAEVFVNGAPGGGNSGRVDARFVHQVVVPAGPGALSPGDPTTLSLSLLADGDLSVANAGLVRATLLYTVIDPTSTLVSCDAFVCEQVTEVVRFLFGASQQRDVVGSEVTQTRSAGYSLLANGASVANVTLPGSGPWSTGPLGFSLLTHVGATLTLDGSLTLFGIPFKTEFGVGGVGADFSNTFDVEVRSAQGLPIPGDTPGVRNFDGSITAVPEPQPAALLLLGLGALALRRRRR